ncbi:MAG: 4-(cytidine 5'-diphospho)-2-C-methyl-D-erythritol kinase [Gemmatimonadetes bacterium]|nr:4-(cytidine 5'-diphospho)-2-C-methyl-D-erythritol kinase [Gemmatimonadota bacterium]
MPSDAILPVASPEHVRVLARAKINLSLRVLARETSGYHQIETVFCALELADEIEITRAHGDVTLEVTAPPGEPGIPPDLGPVGSNLAMRAAAAFFEATDLDGGVHIRLTKRIPAGAGLGGGSSDAAAVLRALNQMSAQALADTSLLALGSRLGSDVPFFLADAALALAWGRGERMLPLSPPPAARVVLAVPRERVSTADAYAALDPARAPTPMVLRSLSTWRDIASVAHNDFEDVIFARHPHLRDVRQSLEDAGATIARMTGSGSVIFGVFEDVAAADAAAQSVSTAHPRIETLVTQTRASLI